MYKMFHSLVSIYLLLSSLFDCFCYLFHWFHYCIFIIFTSFVYLFQIILLFTFPLPHYQLVSHLSLLHEKCCINKV